MDKLEHFIHENRLHFDTEEAPAGLWSKIQSEIALETEQPTSVQKPTPTPRWAPRKIFSYAAIGLLLLAMGAFCSYQVMKSNTASFPASIATQQPMNQQEAELRALFQKRYQQLVSHSDFDS